MTTTSNAQSEQSSFLDHDGIEAALTYVTDNWPNMQLAPAQREAWLDILCQLHQGELKPALRGFPAAFRPDAYAVLEQVLANRGNRRVRDFEKPEPYQRTDTCAQAAERVFSRWAHIMPSRRNRPMEPTPDTQPNERAEPA